MGGECFSRVLQIALNTRCDRVPASEHAPRDPFRVLVRRYDLAEIGEREAVVSVEHPPVKLPHFECNFIAIADNPSRHGHRFAQE